MENRYTDLTTEELRKLVNEEELVLNTKEKQLIVSELARRKAEHIEPLDEVWSKRENTSKWTTSFGSNIYTENAVGFAAFSFGPIAPLYLIYKNYQSLNMKLQARKFALISSILVFVFVATLLISESFIDEIPFYFIPAVMAIFAKLFVKKFQSKHLDSLLDKVKIKASSLKVVITGIVSLLAFTILFIPFVLTAPTMEGKLLHVGKLKHEVFYEDSITNDKANEIASILEELGVLDSKFQTYLKIEKPSIGYRVLLPNFKDISIEESKNYCLFLEFKLNTLYPNDFYQVKIFEDSFLGREVIDCQ